MSESNSEKQSNKEKLQEWIAGLISHFRKEVEKLTQEEQMATSRTLDDLSKPCQFMVIWAEEPEFQIVLITHLTQLEDNHIEIYGPIENSKLIEYIENEVLKSRMIEFLGKERVENFLIGELRSIQQFYNPLHGAPKPSMDGKVRLSSDVYAVGWLVIGSLSNLDLEKIVNETIREIKSMAKPPPLTPQPQVPPILEGFGTYIYPPLWIGEIPRPKSFTERFGGRPLWSYSWERAITDTYKNQPIIITRDGYIAIGEKDRLKAQELINEIMSTMLLRGLVVQVVREIDLGQATFTDSGASFGWNPFSLRTTPFYAERFFLESLPMGRFVTDEEKIRKTIRLAELLTADDRIKTLLSLYLEASTYFANTEFKQTLMMGWIILEDFYIKDLWTSRISKVTTDNNRLSKLGSWNIDQRLEALNLSGALSNEDYDLLMKIKDARNDVVHEGKFPPKDIVERCINLAFKVVQKYVGDHLGKRIVEL
ncbi:MAG: hypothetical protein ACPLYF_02930 [Fervidobacterium sp.]